MKKKQRAYELDIVANKLLEESEKFKHIYIFGAGIIGDKILETLRVYEIMEGYIDNDIQKQKDGYKGWRVYSLEEWKRNKQGLIVIAVGRRNMPDIIEQLTNLGLKAEKDFISSTRFLEEIFPIISLQLFNKSFVNLTQISLTERCTLKCKKCAHGCSAVNNAVAEDLTVEQVKQSADYFFDKVDFVNEFVLIGGEPLLYQGLAEVIWYIGEKYRSKIGIFDITTNGTIVPDEKILNLCTAYRIFFTISNYSATIPRLAASHKRLSDTLDSRGIEYVLNRADNEWMDYGFDYVNRNASEDELIKVFDACKTPCREVRENRFYFCVMARSVSENMGFHVGEKDYLDLETLHGEQGKRELLEFNLGYLEKGYLDMCNYCHGAESVNYPIPVAEQDDKK